MKKGKMVKAIVAAAIVAVFAMAGEAYAAKQPPAQAVDVNKASVSELMTVPGIGASKAAAIVAYRTNAPFSSAEDLANVKGIGQKLFAKIAPYVTVSGQAKTMQPGTAGTTGK